ncbi:MFS transporter, partial [Acinetobacter baumannii]
DIVKAKLSAASVNYQNVAGAPGSVATVKIGDRVITSDDAAGLSKEDAAAKDKELSKALADDIKAAGYPSKADPEQINKPMVLLL